MEIYFQKKKTFFLILYSVFPLRTAAKSFQIEILSTKFSY